MTIQAKEQRDIANRLLAALPREEYERLSQSWDIVHLKLGHVLSHAGELMKDAYFPENGTISLISVTEDGRSIEVAIVGNEGMVGLPLAFGIGATPYQAVVQVHGTVMRMKGAMLRDEFIKHGVFHDILLRHSYALMAQISQTALCNQFHTVEQRLCRWLLMTADRVESDSFELTQQFLSTMLGSGRQGVNAATSSLRKKGLIHYVRGQMTIVDHKSVESASCECYRAANTAFANAFRSSI